MTPDESITRPGDLVQRWYCSDCDCEHEASVIGGMVTKFPESTATCQHCQRGIYHSAIGWMHSHSGNGLCSNAPHLPATPIKDPQCDTCHGDTLSIYCGLVAPPLEQQPLQSLKEVESTRAEEEDYHNAD